MYNDLNSLRIYQYTIDELLNKEDEKMLHLDKNNEGTLYNIKIDEYYVQYLRIKKLMEYVLYIT